MLMPKAPTLGGYTLDALNQEDDGAVTGARFLSLDGHLAVTSTIADGEYRVSVRALSGYVVQPSDVRRIRVNFDMVKADEDDVCGWRFHSPPRMLRQPIGVVVPEVVDDAPEPPMTSRRALSMAFLRPRLMRDA